MSTIVYQGIHSYFESQLIETTTLKLKVASHETKEECHIKETNYNNKPTNLEFSDYSSIQPLSNVSYIQKETTHKQSPYIHPLTKTSPRLSQKNLELCSENLGSETGSDSMDINIMSLYADNSKSRITTIFENDQKVPKQMKSRGHKACNFPPPLTTMRSPNSIQVRPYREDGRLIIEAFETPLRNTHLQAERSNGHLILSFVNNLDLEKTNEDNEPYETEKRESETNQDEEKELNMNMIKNMDEETKENIQRPGKCKENQHGNKNSCFWRKPLCVATS